MNSCARWNHKSSGIFSDGKLYFGGGGTNSKKVNTHRKIPEIDLDFFRLLLTFNKIVQILS